MVILRFHLLPRLLLRSSPSLSSLDSSSLLLLAEFITLGFTLTQFCVCLLLRNLPQHLMNWPIFPLLMLVDFVAGHSTKLVFLMFCFLYLKHIFSLAPVLQFVIGSCFTSAAVFVELLPYDVWR